MTKIYNETSTVTKIENYIDGGVEKGPIWRHAPLLPKK